MRKRILASRKVFTGKIISVRVDQVEEPGGLRVRREVVVHPGAVVVIPRLSDGRVAMVRQYRHAAGRALWELVAGTLEPGEKPLAAARRELREETGYHARALKPLLSFFSSPGIMTERMYLVEARGLRRMRACPDPDEQLEVRLFTPYELAHMLKRKAFLDAKTLVGLLFILSRRPASR